MNHHDKYGLLPIARLEIHFPNWKTERHLDVYDCCNRLNDLWDKLRLKKVQTERLLSKEFILDLSNQIAEKMEGIPTYEFLDLESWNNFIAELYPDNEPLDAVDTLHSKAWMFAHLYWNQLQNFRLTTCWFYNNIINATYNLSEEWLVYERTNDFLRSLSDAGPPIYDGQTFYPRDYIKA